jgi:geranylgeranyl diphosphate synthase type I
VDRPRTPPALEVGNCIHALANICLAGVQARGAQPDLVGKLITALAQSTVQLTIGQRREISHAQAVDVDRETHMLMIGGRSAALMSCAAYGGGLLAMGDLDSPGRRRTRCYAEFGRQLGLGFQIRDDILGIWGAQAAAGESAGGDIRRRKKTLPVVFALREAPAAARGRLQHLYSVSSELTDDQVREVRGVLDGCGAATFAAREAELHGERALRELAGAADGIEQNGSLLALRELAGSLAARTHWFMPAELSADWAAGRRRRVRSSPARRLSCALSAAMPGFVSDDSTVTSWPRQFGTVPRSRCRACAGGDTRGRLATRITSSS